jgi:hypothetical protein
LVDDQTNSWTEEYPDAGVSTHTTSTLLAAAPVSPTTQGTNVTFTATVSGDDSTHPAGTVQFLDGNQDLGTPVTVNTTDGTAAYTTTTPLIPGSHTIHAQFTSTAQNYGNAPDETITYVVNPVAATPTITGTAQVGKQVTCHETTTSGESVFYGWFSGSTKVATTQTLTIPASVANKSLACGVYVTVTGGTAASTAESAAKTVALGAALKATKKPALSGPHKVGKVEKVSTGNWSPKAKSYSYQWYLGSKKIAHATKSSLKLTKSEKGKKISVKVTAKASGYANGSATSNSVKVTS